MQSANANSYYSVLLQVVRLDAVWCHMDADWSLELLQRAAPTVERLWVLHPREPHLRAVLAMPRLRRLRVDSDGTPLPAELGALPPGHCGLRWLHVWRLPRATTQALLRLHGATLEELVLYVGTRGGRPWPDSCSDLHVLLGQCGLRALRRLVLWRWSHHTDTDCRQQREQVRRALPGVEVLCGECDRVPEEYP